MNMNPIRTNDINLHRVSKRSLTILFSQKKMLLFKLILTRTWDVEPSELNFHTTFVNLQNAKWTWKITYWRIYQTEVSKKHSRWCKNTTTGLINCYPERSYFRIKRTFSSFLGGQDWYKIFEFTIFVSYQFVNTSYFQNILRVVLY